MICFAKNAGVDLTTIDCVGEVEKLKKYQPNARMLLRLKADDSASKYKLGNKFGVTLDEVDDVLSAAQKLDINIVGIAFHVGSDCHSADAFNSAIVMAAEVCSKLPSYGFKMQILDIGGGFPGDIDFNDPDNTFYRMARTINASLDLHFPRVRFPTLKIISEPGRYFVSSAFRLLTKVVGKRFIKDKKEVMYYMNDGLFGGFLIKFWEPEMIKVKPMLTLTTLESRKEYRSTLWGPTCDSSDVIVEGIQLKEMEVGEYFVTSNFGAYTVPLTTPFNGMDKPIYKVFYGHKSAFLESPINDILITNGV
jgi:ornithine decarboxylase